MKSNMPRLLAAVLLMGPLTGQAVPIAGSITKSYSPTLVNSGSPFSGSFDATGIFSPPSNYAVTNLSATFFFTDDSDAWRLESQSTGAYAQTAQSSNSGTYGYVEYYSCGFFSTCSRWRTTGGYTNVYTTYTRNGNRSYVNDLETASVVAGADSGTASSSAISPSSSTTGQSDGNTYSVSGCGNSSCWTTYYNNSFYTNWNDTYSGFGGAFSLAMNLGPGALNDFLADWALGFTVTSGSGDFLLTGARLDFLYEEEIRKVEPNAVPEPGTLALLGLGIAGLGLTRRRRAN